MRRSAKSGELRAAHVAWMAAGFCLMLFGLNGYFLAKAISTFPGEVAPKSYVQGLEFNTTLMRRAAQRQAGWTAEAGVESGQVLVRVRDRLGSPVSGLEVTTEIHVAGEPVARTLVLAPSDPPGEYSAPLPIRESRRLDLSISARRGGELVFEAHKAAQATSHGRSG